jgi:predicted nicotinamide N-methyase
MQDVRVRYRTIEFGNQDIHLRTLRDTQEVSDESDVCEKHGVSTASWGLFGVVWPAGHALAELMIDYDVRDKRVLEVGCGIGLASLVLNHRNVDVTATDYNSDAHSFLDANTELNGDRLIPFVRADWSVDASTLGEFELVIGSDLLYEPDHVNDLAEFIEAHSCSPGQVIIVDPNRGRRGKFSQRMVEYGYTESALAGAEASSPASGFSGRIALYTR